MVTNKSHQRFFCFYLPLLIVLIVQLVVFNDRLVPYWVADQFTHLNRGRLLFSSYTPGLSQLSSWLPLLHFLLSPFTAIDFLYYSGLAGSFITIPSFLICCWAFYSICSALEYDDDVSFFAVCIFICNPFVLYYSVTPTTEVLYMACLFSCALFALRYQKSGDFNAFLLWAICCSLATLARLEGIFLLPVSFFIIIFSSLQIRESIQQIVARLTLFYFIAMLGVAFLLVYGVYYAGDILAFTSHEWLTDSKSDLEVTQWNIVETARHLLSATKYMLGPSFVFLGLFCFTFCLLWKKKNKIVSTSLLLIFPTMFIGLAVYIGRIPINVPELAPYKGFFNERYGLTSIGFFIIVIAFVLSKIHNIAFRRSLFVLLVVYSLYHSSQQILFSFPLIRSGTSESFISDQRALASFLSEHYDGEKVLMYHFKNESLFVLSHIPTNQIIQEANFPYFQQAVQTPWDHVQWVISLKGKARPDLINLVEKTRTFKKEFSIVYEDDNRIVYRRNITPFLIFGPTQLHSSGASL